MKKIIFFSFHYPPDLSAGAIRTEAIVKEILKQNKTLKLWVFCSIPRRYNNSKFQNYDIASKNKRLLIKRLWIPFFGQSPFASVLSYGFYCIQAIPLAIFIRPDIVIGTSAKLLTSFIAACSAYLTKAKLYIDFRDTFSDNFFYFYRWHKRIIFQSIILTIENIVLRCSNSINMVSIGFKNAFTGWEKILNNHSISITNYPNGIKSSFKKKIKNATSISNTKIKNYFRVVYAGNLGEGQDIIKLIKSLDENKHLLKKLEKNKIIFEIYGSGSQLKKIKNYLGNKDFKNKVNYCGLVPRNKIHEIYQRADFLMLHLAEYLSLSLVIPSKIFEYVATPYPIIYSASGFTRNFIEEIEGTIHFKQGSFESFFEAILIAKKMKINLKKRAKFLDSYSQEKIIKEYVRHILS